MVRTTLSAAITASQTLIPVTSTTPTVITGTLGNFPAVGAMLSPQQPMTIDDEVMFIVQVISAGLVQVRMRGSDGTFAASHDVFSTVTTGLASEYPFPTPGTATLRPIETPDVVTYGQDQAIPAPTEDVTIAYLAKATAGAFTLPAPGVPQDGIELVITSRTSFAHAITSNPNTTPLFNNGVTGSPFTSVTFPAFVGASLTLISSAGTWNVKAATPAVASFTFA